MNNTVYQRIWLPGFLFMGVLIGGGYATGRELVEFFLTAGTVGGLLGMLLATAMFSVITALSFELARLTRSYTYRHFFRELLGRGWFLYELAYLTLGILVLAVVGSAAGEIAAQRFGLSPMLGTALLMSLIGVLVFFGTAWVERVLSGWSLMLYGTYGIFVACYLATFSGDLWANLAQEDLGSGWFTGGVKYVGYSIAVIPVILFSVEHMETRRDAFIAGALAGPIAMIPAFIFFLTMIATYPDVLDAAVPADFMMARLDLPLVSGLFYVAVFGTFVQTGTGFVHAVNERIAEVIHEHNREMPRWLRPLVALLALIFSVSLASRFGLVDLIAGGYGTLTWVFIAVFLLPLLTVGLHRIFQGA